MTAGIDAAERAGQVGCARSWRRLQARLLLRRGKLGEAEAMLAGELDGDAAASTADDARALLTMGELAIHVGDDRRTKALAGIAERAVETRGPAVRRSPPGSSRVVPRRLTTAPALAPGWAGWVKSATSPGYQC